MQHLVYGTVTASVGLVEADPQHQTATRLLLERAHALLQETAGGG